MSFFSLDQGGFFYSITVVDGESGEVEKTDDFVSPVLLFFLSNYYSWTFFESVFVVDWIPLIDLVSVFAHTSLVSKFFLTN